MQFPVQILMEAPNILIEFLSVSFTLPKQKGYFKIWSSRNGESKTSFLLHADFSLGLLLNPDDGGDMFHRNVDWLSSSYTALHPRW
jgi:hypothetical protein